MKIVLVPLIFFFQLLARFGLLIHRPQVIGITGNVGKTTTKDMLLAILTEAGVRVRGSKKSYNSEMGVPLSILGLTSGIRNPFRWLLNMVLGVWNALFVMPKVLVLEIGVDAPGDMTRVIRWLSFDRALVTALSRNPVHRVNFPSVEALYEEKMALFCGLKVDGVGFYDDASPIQKDFLPDAPGTLTGFSSSSVSLVNASVHYNEGHKPVGTDVLLSIDGKEEPFYIPDALGVGVVHSLLTAVILARSLKEEIPVTAIRKAIASRKPTAGRMRILPGRGSSVIVDDSYNASPVAVERALEMLSMLEMKRKVLVLGKMAELGDDERAIHKQIGEKASSVADVVLTLSDIPYGEKVENFADHEALVRRVETLLSGDTVFLCKGSQVSRMEKVVKALLSPEMSPEEVLVRQESWWQ